MFNLFQLNIYDCGNHKTVKQILGFHGIILFKVNFLLLKKVQIEQSNTFQVIKHYELVSFELLLGVFKKFKNRIDFFQKPELTLYAWKFILALIFITYLKVHTQLTLCSLSFSAYFKGQKQSNFDVGLRL